MAIIALLTALLVPVLSRAKESGRRTACMSNLRQLGVALSIYTGDNEGEFPLITPTNRWPSQLYRGYENLDVLVCPSDHVPRAADYGVRPDEAPRSYVMNLFRDYYAAVLSPVEMNSFNGGFSPHAINESQIHQPSDTIIFGEKKTGATNFYVDIGTPGASVSAAAEQRRHRSGASERSGGSNHGFADGSVKYVPYGRALLPINLWAVTDSARTNAEAPR